jgi:hypothetical protein
MKFTYTALLRPTEEIRVVRLLPRFPRFTHNADLICCEIAYISLQDMPRYEALSYTWGDPNPCKMILLDGKPFSVRVNLWLALFHLRQLSLERVLWIDAICIDQGNVHERNHQVNRMGNIYKGASKVLVWLGLEKDDSSRALSFIEAVGKLGQTLWQSAHSYFSDSESEREYLMDDPDFDPAQSYENICMAYEKYMKPNVYDKEWASLKLLCDRPYWKRIWIIQEVCFASQLEIHCEFKSIPWECFAAICDNFKFLPVNNQYNDFICVKRNTNPGQEDPKYLHDVLGIKRSIPAQLCKLRRHHNEHTLVTLLRIYGDSCCQDPRDKVYALLGLASDCRGDALVPDYSKTTFELYWDVMWFHNLGAYDYRTHNYYFSERFIPNTAAQTISFSCYLQRILGGPLAISGSNDTAQASNEQESAPFSQRPKLIWFTGTLHSTVHILDNPNEPTIGVFDTLKLFELNEEKVIPIQCATSYAILPRQKSQPNPTQISKGSPILSELKLTKNIKKSNPDKIGFDVVYFTDSYGRAGIAPAGTQRGDVLCSFTDSDVVAVLRRNNDRYHFVGRAVQLPSDSEVHGAELLFSADAETLQLLTS